MIFIEPGKLDWEDVPDPTLHQAGEAIVRPLVMGRCDLDTLYIAGFVPLASGEPIGHEIIGEIIDLGDEAGLNFHIGQKVIVPAQVSCGSCRMCLAGETGRCEQVPLGASYGMGRDGGFGGAVADFVHVPFAKGMLVPLPDKVELPPLMGLADMATDAWRAVGPQLERRPGGTVLVMGGATPVIGIYAAALAVNLGADRVVYVDPDNSRCLVAADYGADTALLLDDVEHPTFDIVVDASGDTSRLQKAIHACGPAGQLTSIVPPITGPLELPTQEMYFKGIDWHIGRPNCRHGHEPALKAWSCQGFKPDKVGPKVYSFEDAVEAWLDPALYVAVKRD